jgi:prophage regulatory protein
MPFNFFKKTMSLPVKPRVLKVRGVAIMICRSTASIYEMAKSGLFPRPIKIGPRSSGWLVEEVEQWLADQAKKRDEGSEA